MPAPMSVEEFLRLSREVHGTKYGYSRARNLEQVVDIRCPKHGWFRQRRVAHAKAGNGCPGCSRESHAAKLRLSRDEYLKRASAKHKNKYDYSEVTYVNGMKAKETIICPLHGSFVQSLHGHLIGGNGCPDCGVRKTILGGLTRKRVVRQGRVFRLQGHEPQALDWMLKTHNLRAQDIAFGEEVPVLEYDDGTTRRKHYPDFWIPSLNRLVEVKSKWSCGLGSDPRTRKAFRLLRAKRKAALALGYKYTLILIDAKGRRLSLPKDWHLLSLHQFKKSLEELNDETPECSSRNAGAENHL